MIGEPNVPASAAFFSAVEGGALVSVTFEQPDMAAVIKAKPLNTNLKSIVMNLPSISGDIAPLKLEEGIGSNRAQHKGYYREYFLLMITGV